MTNEIDKIKDAIMILALNCDTLPLKESQKICELLNLSPEEKHYEVKLND